MNRKSIGNSPKTIQNVFVLLLLSVFACLSTFLVTIGAQLYRGTVDSGIHRPDRSGADRRGNQLQAHIRL